MLHTFERWPTWMWANEEIVALVEWLRRHNEHLAEVQKAGFYGLDVYSLWDSLYQVMGYLSKHAPDRLAAARKAFNASSLMERMYRIMRGRRTWSMRHARMRLSPCWPNIRRTDRSSPDGSQGAHFNGPSRTP